MVRIALLTDGAEWHARRLAEAAARRGVDLAIGPLADCAVRVGEGGPGIDLGPAGPGLPDGVLVRSVAAGSFEQVTLRLGVLHALSALGLPVINTARAIERCVDKSMTSFLLHAAGIPTPPALATERDAAVETFRRGQGGDVVLKPLFGSQGRRLARLAPGDPLPPPVDGSGVHYVQRYVGRAAAWRDYRVFVVGGEPIAAMIRHGKTWVTNVKQGAHCEAVAPSGNLGELAAAAAAAVGADYAGVDLIDDEAGRLTVLEVNSMPAWQGLQSVAEIDIADRIIAHVLARV